MNISKHKYYFTLFDFNGMVMARLFGRYKGPKSATTRGAALLFSSVKCARVLIESDWGFHITIAWGDKVSINL